MKLLISRCSEPAVFRYENKQLSRLLLEDFTTHTLLPDNNPDLYYNLPTELVILVLKHLLQIRIQTRNFDQAFQVFTVNRLICDILYSKIYGRDNSTPKQKLFRLGRTFELIQALYDDYLTTPNLDGIDRVAINLTRIPIKYRSKTIFPWDFRSDIRLEEMVHYGSLEAVHCFTGDFHGQTVWIHGEENNGMYDTSIIHHPVFVFILSDYTSSLIPTRRDLNVYWTRFICLLKACFGSKSGIYMMVMENEQRFNPFVETNDLFLQY